MTDLDHLNLTDVAHLRDLIAAMDARLVTVSHRRAEPAVKPTKKRPLRPPTVGIDIRAFDGMTDREAAAQLGAKPPGRYAGMVRTARKSASNPPSYRVCEAGVLMRFGLRCELAAVPGEAWCRSHHPDPPPMPTPAPSSRERERIAQHELSWRPDGNVLRALYEQTDNLHELTVELRWHREHVQHLESLQLAENRPGWLTLQQAADYAGRSVSALRNGVTRGHLKASRPRGTKVWSVRPADLDAWLSEEPAAPQRRTRTRGR